MSATPRLYTMPKDSDKRYIAIPGFRDLRQDRQLALRHFVRRGVDSYQRKSFLYEIQVGTRDRRSGDLIYRTISITEKKRGLLGEVLDDAAHVVMDSPTAAREDLVSTRIIAAYHNPYAEE